MDISCFPEKKAKHFNDLNLSVTNRPSNATIPGTWMYTCYQLERTCLRRSRLAHSWWVKSNYKRDLQIVVYSFAFTYVLQSVCSRNDFFLSFLKKKGMLKCMWHVSVQEVSRD